MSLDLCHWPPSLASSIVDGGHFFFSLALSFFSSMKESSILFKLSSSSNTGWKYSWRLNKEGVGSGVLAIDSVVCCSPIAVFVAVGGPLMIRRLTKELDISHFNEAFSAEEADIEIRRLELKTCRVSRTNRTRGF